MSFCEQQRVLWVPCLAMNDVPDFFYFEGSIGAVNGYGA